LSVRPLHIVLRIVGIGVLQQFQQPSSRVRVKATVDTCTAAASLGGLKFGN